MMPDVPNSTHHVTVVGDAALLNLVDVPMCDGCGVVSAAPRRDE
jgi:hypothetical protein